MIAAPRGGRLTGFNRLVLVGRDAVVDFFLATLGEDLTLGAENRAKLVGRVDLVVLVMIEVPIFLR